jgi:phosphoribosylformylglycinamidine cyclo-ligase
VDAAQQAGLQSWIAGRVVEGPKQVLIEPLDLGFAGDELHVRA